VNATTITFRIDAPYTCDIALPRRDAEKFFSAFGIAQSDGKMDVAAFLTRLRNNVKTALNLGDDATERDYDMQDAYAQLVELADLNYQPGDAVVTWA
jgi:hypothetical protein